MSINCFAQLSTVGKEFVVGFMENYRRENQPDVAVIILSANEDSEGFIQAGNINVPFSIRTGEQFIHEFSGDFIHRTSGEKEKKSIYISSSGDIAVHAFNHRQRSGDGTVVLPINSLGKDYYVTAHADVFGADQDPGSNNNFESTFLVLAVEDNTQLEIIASSGTVHTVPANAPMYITLNAGESYQVKGIGDLTGSRVKVLNGEEGDCKNVAVFGGNKLTSVGDCGTTGDHLFQQSYPIKSWGKSYIHVPLADRTSGEIVKVLASENGTEVKVDGNTIGTLNAGKFLKINFAPDQVASIESNKPIAVTVLSKSQACNAKSTAFTPFGDPSMITYSANDQRLKSIVFSSVPETEIERHFVNLIVPRGSADQTFLNGRNVGSEFNTVPGNSDFEYAQIEVQSGVNSISNPEGFIGYAYGSGFIESYGFAMGASLENVQFETEVAYSFEVEGDRVACYEKEGNWKILPDNPLFTSFIWDFGDGTDLQEGQEVTHTFAMEGTFEVKIKASTGDGSCDSEEEFKFEVEVKNIEGELIGPRSVCPNADEVLYKFSNTENFDKVIWEVENGTQLISTDSTITIKWDQPTQNGKVRAIPLSENGCEGEIQEIQVVVDEDFEPDLPLGPEGICGLQAESLTYQVPFPTANYTYNWVVVGGIISAGQGSEEILVIWDFDATVRSLQYEVTSIDNSLCAGSSEILEVKIFSAFNIEKVEKIAPACPGEANGSILIEPSGGSGLYEVIWSHNPDLDSFAAYDLPSGTYEVTIKDLSGCGEETIKVQLEDLEALEVVGTILTEDVSCEDKGDGAYRVKIKGGTSPYEILGFDSNWDGEFLNVFGIEKGMFAHTVVDSRGCSMVLEGEIGGPLPLELSFSEEKPGCPGGSDGVLEVLVKGGTEPYTIAWENGLTGNKISGLSSGEFSVIVTDVNGCVISGEGKISESKPQVRMPTGFNPANGIYEPITNCTISYQLFIWDRWGQLIYSGSEGWNGQFRGSSLPLGTYTYKIDYKFPLEGNVGMDSNSGTFTLVQ
ncbi:PKD domain-containing protein [Algoriphagus aestuarii]|nr:PKD domain-containing protein [Algoriphagus aestuarii]